MEATSLTFGEQRVEEAAAIESQSLEVNVGVPEGLFKGFNQSDISIDMEYDPAAGGAFSSAAITLDENVLESSFTGQGDSCDALQESAYRLVRFPAGQYRIMLAQHPAKFKSFK